VRLGIVMKEKDVFDVSVRTTLGMCCRVSLKFPCNARDVL
jgi:hypothetical protein